MRKLKNEELGRLGIEEFKRSAKLPVIIILDDVRSMHNVGSVFRTADAFAIEAVYLCGITGRPPHREIEKSALGATRSIRWKHFDDITECLQELQDQNYRLFALEQAESSLSLSDFSPDKMTSLGLIFGNEVSGVSDKALTFCENCIEIPQFGTKHSFNIAVSAGIVLWDYYMKTR